MPEKFIYLLKVKAGENNNKFYRMTAQGDEFLAEWGRVGTKGQKKIFPIRDWDKKYRAKTGDGYVDKTENIAEEIVVQDKVKYQAIPDRVVAEIVKRLQSMAKDAIEKNYDISIDKVTQKMIDEAELLISKLLRASDFVEFNEVLLELFQTIPRKMYKVADNLLEDKTDIQKLILIEQDLLDVVKGQVAIKKIEVKDSGKTLNKTILDVMGLEIAPVTDCDIRKIKKSLNSLSSSYVDAWKVKNKKTQNQFNQFVKDNNIKDKRLLWHGSRNENWWSILRTGLALRPNAVITGKMFGIGLYFSINSQKSKGYTSGGYWAGGVSDRTVFMALFDTAYGNPYDVNSFESRFNSFNYEKLQTTKAGANCLHAHKGRMLRNDEIVYYKEEQMTVKYLVELKS